MTNEQWEVEVYEIISVQPTNDFWAVYAVENEEDDFLDLKAFPISAIGVAAVTRHIAERVSFDPYRARQIGEKTTTREIVGLGLDDGYWHIVNEASNFAGLVRTGDKADVTGCLKPEYIKRLREQAEDA